MFQEQFDHLLNKLILLVQRIDSRGALLVLLSITPFLVLVLWRLWRFSVMPLFHPDKPKELPYWIPCKQNLKTIPILIESNELEDLGRLHITVQIIRLTEST